MAIVAIAAHAKINPGDIFHDTSNGYPELVVVATRPYWVSYPNTPSGSWCIRLERADGRPYVEFLGDLGFPGFAYDSRPCRLVKNPTECLGRIHETEEWHRDQDFMDPPFFECDYA